MKQSKWSVSRFQQNNGFMSRNKYDFQTKFIAHVVLMLCHIEALLFNLSKPWMCYIPKYSIDADLGVNFADEGQWRSYKLTTSGDSFEQLYEDATISEIDQDGDDIRSYGLREASSQIQEVVLKIINV